MDKRKLTVNELSMRGGAAGEEIIRTLQSLVGRSANFIVAQQKSCDPNPKLTPPPPRRFNDLSLSSKTEII